MTINTVPLYSSNKGGNALEHDQCERRRETRRKGCCCWSLMEKKLGRSGAIRCGCLLIGVRVPEPVRGKKNRRNDTWSEKSQKKCHEPLLAGVGLKKWKKVQECRFNLKGGTTSYAFSRLEGRGRTNFGS